MVMAFVSFYTLPFMPHATNGRLRILSFIISFRKQNLMIRARSALIRAAATIDNDLDHQGRKNKIIQEQRKQFLRQADDIKEKYASEIEKLKNQNTKLKELRDKYLSAKKARTLKADLSETGLTLKSTLTSNNQNYLRNTLDKERHQTNNKKKLLFTLQDKLKDAEDQRQSVCEENPLLKTIYQLQNKLDKIMVRYNEAQSIQHTYEEIVRKLKQEKIGYDSHLMAIQNSLKGKQHEFQQLLLLSHDATHAKQAAILQLRQFEQRRKAVQEMRIEFLTEKKVQFSKELSPSDAFEQTGQDPVTHKGILFDLSYENDDNFQRQELYDYQIAFQKIKKVTGVSDPNQIIQKFKTQTLTNNSLEELQSSYAAKIQNLKTVKEQLKAKVANSKFQEKNLSQKRRRFDQIDSQMTLINSRYSNTKERLQKLNSTMISITSGVKHLKQMTQSYRSETDALQDSLESDLKNIDNKLGKIYSIVKSDPNFMNFGFKAFMSDIRYFMQRNMNFAQINEENGEEEQLINDEC